MDDKLKKEEDYQDRDLNPMIPGGKAAAEEKEKEDQENLQSPATNPFLPGASPIDTEVSLEKQMATHDALMLGDQYVLIKRQAGKFELLSPEGQFIDVSLAEAEKFRDSPEGLKDLFFK